MHSYIYILLYMYIQTDIAIVKTFARSWHQGVALHGAAPPMPQLTNPGALDRWWVHGEPRGNFQGIIYPLVICDLVNMAIYS